MSERIAISIYRSGIRAIATFIVSCSFVGNAQQMPQKLQKHVPSVVSNGRAELVAKLPESQKVQLAIILPVRNQSGLTSLLSEIYDPMSLRYRQFLTVKEFTDQFGPTVEDYEDVIKWATDNGLTVTGQQENRLILDVSGSVGRVNATFNVSMNEYRDPVGKRNFYSLDREPTLNLSVPIARIEGLDNFSIPVSMLKVSKNGGAIANVTGSGPGGSYLGSDMRAAYYGGTLLTGTGQCVGLLEFEGYNLSDVNATFNNAGQTYNVPVNNVSIDSAFTGLWNGEDDAEQVLDIVQAIGMAPGLSQVRVYIGQYPGNAGDIFNKMATENVCKQLSVSWSWAVSDPTAYDGIFQEFQLQGQTVFVASGDSGAYDPSISDFFYPADDALITSVGGTHLTTNYGGGPWVAESAWNSPPDASGGGVSPDNVPIPSWQQGVATAANGGSHYLRNVPDVAMEADLDNYYCYLGVCQGGAGGTSFAAPRWAGFMALVNQQAAEAGRAPVGFLNPTLYSIGQGTNYNLDFHDVVTGNNDSDSQAIWYNAVTGYDLVTGWGSPNGQNLITALAGALVPGFWITSAPSSLSLYQGTSGTTTISVTDAGGFASNVNLSVSGLPIGVTASFNPTSTSGTSELLLTAASSAALGSATLTISGASGSLSASIKFTLTVNTPQAPPLPVGGLGSVNIGATSNSTAVTVKFSTAGTLHNISVLTQGSPNLDFSDAGGDTCTIGTAYAVNATCTVYIKFAPKRPGVRYGAVVLSDTNGNQLAQVYLLGSGIGPQTVFNPGSQTTFGSGFISPEDAAITGNGSVYATDYGSATIAGALYQETWSNGTYTQTKLSCTLKSPTGVAVDGSGTVYVADPGVPAVYKLTTSNGTCAKISIGSGFTNPRGITTDGSGNVYITDIGSETDNVDYPAQVFKETLQSNGTYVQTTVGNGWVAPVGIAVDPAGNVYVADSGAAGVFMDAPSGGSYAQTPIGRGWIAPIGLALDGEGNIYVSDAGNSLNLAGTVQPGVYKEVLSNGSFVQTAIGAGWSAPYGLALDGLGNVVVADALRGLYREDLADPPQFIFANTASGTSSTDSPRNVTVTNQGTDGLNFSAISYPSDFPEVGTSPANCASNTSLNPTQACTLSIEFRPTASLNGSGALPLIENVSITTNTLNTSTQQAVLVSGTEVLPGGTVTLAVSTNPSTAGNSVTFVATVAGSSSGPAATGTVTFYNGSTPLSGAISLVNAVATYSTASLVPGTYSISALYSGDGNYAGSSSSTITESIIVAPGTAPSGTTNLGAANIGGTGSVAPLTFTFTQAEILGGIAVLTQGVPNLDFTNAGGGTCATGSPYTVNSTCTVNVMFSPKYPGERCGAVVLTDSNGNLIGTTYLEGTGTGPQTSFLPGTLTSLPGSFVYPQSVAVDGAGNVYIADSVNAAVYKESLANGTYTESTIGTGLIEPSSVAVDGAGNVYVADSGGHSVYIETASKGTYIQASIGYGFNSPSGVAVDGLGNVYVADFGNGVTPGGVYLESLSNGSYIQVPIQGTFVSPQGIAVDLNGNVFVADSANGKANGAVYELSPSNGTYSQLSIGTGWNTPTSVAVDGNGDVFVADDSFDLGAGFIAEESRQPNGTFVQTLAAESSTIPYPAGIAVSGNGNRYITDNLEAIVYREDITDPPSLSFATTIYGQMSSDSPQTVTVQNAGNASLNFSALSYPTDFPEASGIPGDCTSSAVLADGATCTISVDFRPASSIGSNQSTTLNETVTLTTNSLNIGPNPQSLAVSGIEAAPTAAVVLSVPATISTVGASVTFTATMKGGNGFAVPTGSVIFYSNGATLATVPLTNGTAAYSTSSLAVGNYTITASYSGDGTYPSATSNPITERIIAATTFGTQAVGGTSSQLITVTFTAKVTLGSVSVVTQGATNMDFTNAGGGTCTVGTAYSAGSTCKVNVSFKPLYPGSRFGAIVLGNNKGVLIQSITLLGTGIGPQLKFLPGIPKTIITQQGMTGAFVVDENGTVYLGSSSGGKFSVTKWTNSGGNYSSTTIPTTSLGGSLAVDASGSVYVSNYYLSNKQWDCSVLKETLLNGTYSESVVTSGQPCNKWNIAVDPSGNVYISDGANYRVLKETLSGGVYTQSTIPSGTLYGPAGIAVDSTGNVYLNDAPLDVIEDYPQSIFKFAPSGSSYVETTIVSSTQAGFGISVPDGYGNIYFRCATLSGSQLVEQLIEAIPSGNGYTIVSQPADPLTAEDNVGLDGGQNWYWFGSSTVTRLDSSDPPSVSFSATNVGNTSSDSPQTIAIKNSGNAPLTLSVPSAGTNPSVSSSFSLSGNTTCPDVNSSGPAGVLSVGASCNYNINFTPTTTGTISGSLILTGNLMGGAETIPLSGIGTTGAPGGNIAIVRLIKGPNGVPIGELITANAASYLEVWVDTSHKTLIDGFIVMPLNAQGLPVCTTYYSTTVTPVREPLYNGLFYSTENFGLQGCPGQVFPYTVVRATWGSISDTEQDLMSFKISGNGSTWQNNYAAELSRVTLSPTVLGGSGSNPPLTATATLMRPPFDAAGFDWQIVGGNGSIVFPNGSETMSSTTNSIPIEWPSPTPSSVPFNIQVGVRSPSSSATSTATSDPLLYGPNPDSFSSFPKGNGDCSDEPGSCAAGDPISIGTGNVFEKVVDYETAGQNKLSYIRYYNSLPLPNTFALTLGARWRSNYDRYLNFTSGSLVTAERADGQLISFHQSGSSWMSDSDTDDTLTQSGTTWTLKDHDDTVETYTQLSSGMGLLQSITLRNGYEQFMVYGSNNILSAVTDSYNRQLQFTYANGVLNTVTTPDNLVLTYSYNTIKSPNDQLASVSYSTSPVTKQQYLYQNSNVPYALTGIVDENGNTYESWTYDNNGRGLSNQVGGLANRITVSYGDTNLSRTVTNAFGVTDTYTFSILQNVPKVIQITRAATSTTAGASETFAYDSNGYLNSETDWSGNQTTYVNDSHGDPTTINEAVGSPVARTTAIAYDPIFVHLPSTITTSGLTTSFTYDGSGNVSTKTLTDTTTQSIPYSTNGSTRVWQYTWQNSLLASAQSPRTDVVEKTSYGYDGSGTLTSITNPLNQQTNITSHTGGGLPLTIVDPNGVSTTLAYDPRQHLLNSTIASHITRYGYDSAENLTSVTQPDGSGLVYSYDSAHRLTGITDLLGQKTSYTLDALGDPQSTKILNTSGVITSQHSNTFDALGRMLKDIGAANQTSSFTYDPVGNMLTATDQVTNRTQRSFDALNRLYQVTDPASGLTTTSYDAHDRPLSVTAPTGGATSYLYNGFGDLIQESSSNTGTTVYYYDNAGNRTKRVAATGAVTQYAFDALDRVLTMTFPSDGAENVSYTYDQSGHGYGIGKLTSVSDAAGTLSRTFDQFGNLLTDVRTTSAAVLTTAYSYDIANRIASITYPSGAVVSYTRDTMGRVTSVSAQPSGGTSAPVVSNIAYEPFGPSSGLTYGNAVAETRGFDQDYRLTGVMDTGTSALQSLAYAYYPTNNVHTITDAVTSSNSQSFSYDNLQRLNQATGGYGSFGFTYDKDGNRLTQTLGTTTTNYGYGAGNDLLATLTVGGVQTQAIGYTADGRVGTLSPGIQAPGGQYISSLSYNQDGRLSAVNAVGGALGNYTYDGFEQRVVKTISSTTGNLYQYGQDGMLLEETNASGLAQADYIYLDGRPVAVLNGSTLYFLHDDRLGTPQLATDSSQNVQWQASYDAFGQASVSGTITQNLRFPGQYFDVESGWNHNGFRDYIPDVGRYAEPDPLESAFGGNKYVYAGNAPIDFIDPSGEAYQVSLSNNTFTVSASITLYGPNATGALAKIWQNDINNVWNSQKFLHNGCSVKFAVTIQADPNANHWFTAKSADNYVFVQADSNFRSYVNAGSWLGQWSAGVQGSGFGPDGNDYASHEAGHFFGLPDYYRDHQYYLWGPQYTYPGHEEDIMGVGGPPLGWPTQQDVDQILKKNKCKCR